MFQTALAIEPTVFAKAHGGLSKAPKPKLGYADGMAVIAIGPKGGKIVGWKNGKPVYGGSAAAKKLKAQKTAAKTLKAPPAQHPADSDHAKQIEAWLDELGVTAKGHGYAGVFVVSAADAKKLTDSFPDLKTVPTGGMVKVKTSSLWDHVGEPLIPHADELVAWAAKGASGADEDPPFSDTMLATLKLKGALGGTHGGKIVVDDKGNQYAWKTNNGQTWVSRAEEVFNRVAKLVFPEPELYPDAEMVTHEGDKGVLLSWIDSKGNIGNEVSGDHGVQTSVLQKHFERLVQHQVLDWMMSNHDSHGANFVHTMDGDIAALDKGQAFKAIGADKLSDSYKLNPSSPAYNAMWKLFQQGDIKGDPVKAAAEVLNSIEKNLSLEQYHSIVAPYLEEAGAGLDGFTPKKKWALIEQRFKDLRSNWETFLSEMTGESVTIPGADEGPPAAAPVEDKAAKPVDVAQVPGWPMTKGKVTVMHPGGPHPSGWPSNYPGPGYYASVKVAGNTFAFAFELNPFSGKMEVQAQFPDGKFILYPSPAAAADGTQLFNKNLPLDMNSSDKKKNGIALSATKLFELEQFAEDLKAAGLQGAATIASKTYEELVAEKKVTPEQKALTLHEMLATVEDGIIADSALIPNAAKLFAAKHAKATVPHDWPANLPLPGSVIKALDGGGSFDIYVAHQSPDGAPLFKYYSVASNGAATEYGAFSASSPGLKPVLLLPSVSAAAKATQQLKKPKPPPPPKPVVGLAPKAEVISDFVVQDTILANPVYPKKGGPLPVGHKHTMLKPFVLPTPTGVGTKEYEVAVDLEVLEEGFKVSIAGVPGAAADAEQTFKSLSAASDWVWLRQKGYEDKADYKKQTGKTKVASGGGWEFFGVKPKSGELMTFATPLTPSAPGEPGWDDWKLPSGDELAALPEGTMLVYGEPGSKPGPETLPGEDGWVKTASGWKPLGITDIPALSDEQLSSDIAGDASSGYGGMKVLAPDAPAAQSPLPLGVLPALFGAKELTLAELAAMPLGSMINNGEKAFIKESDEQWVAVGTNIVTHPDFLPLSSTTWKVLPGPVPDVESKLLWKGAKLPSLVELSKLPLNSVLKDSAGYTYKKVADGYVNTIGSNFSATEMAASDLKIIHQPGAAGGSGAKPLTVAELTAMAPGSSVTHDKDTYTKHNDSKWYSKKLGDEFAFSPKDFQPESFEWLVQMPHDPVSTVQPEPKELTPLELLLSGWSPATPSISGDPGPVVVTTKESLPDFAEKEAVWTNAQKLAGAPVPGKPDKTYGMKSPHWDPWVPPTGVWLQGEWKGKKTWITTTASGYNTDGSAPWQVKFVAVNEDGAVTHGDANQTALYALGSALGKTGSYEAMEEAFHLDTAAFAQDDTFATHAALITADSAIGAHPQDIPPEQKTKAVVTKMVLGDYIQQESVQQKYGGKFTVSPHGGEHVLRFYPNAGASLSAAGVLQTFIDDHNLAPLKPAQAHIGALNAWCLLGDHGATVKEFAVETTAIEAASTPPTITPAPNYDWPGTSPVNSVDTLEAAPVGASVHVKSGDKLVKLANGNWAGIGDDGEPMSEGIPSSLVADFTLESDSGYAGFDPALGNFSSMTPAELKALPVGTVLHSDHKFGIQLVKENVTYWKGNDGNLYGNTSVATHSVVVDPLTVKTPSHPSGVKKVKALGGHLKSTTINDKIKELPANVKLHTKWGDIFTADGGKPYSKFTGVDKMGEGIGVYASHQIASLVKDAGGASVQWPGDKVKKKKTPVTLQVVKPKVPVNSEQIKKAQAWTAWAKDNLKPTDAEDLLVLAHFQKQLADGGYTAGLHVHEDGKGNYLLAGKDANAFHTSVENWEGMPPSTDSDSPLGTMLVVKKSALAKRFPDAKYLKAAHDGLTYPKGTTFEVNEIVTKTVRDVVLADLTAIEPGKPKKIKAHDSEPDKLVIKFNGVSAKVKEDAAAYLAAKGITAHGEPQVSVSTVFTVSKADLDAAFETSKEVTPILPELPPAFVQAPVPFALGPQKQGGLAVNNEGDLAALDSFKMGHWGHSIRHGAAGLWQNHQVSVRRVDNPDGEDYYELTGDLLHFEPDASKLSKGVVKYYHPVDKKGAPSFDIYDEDTGLHKKGNTPIEGGWGGYDGKTDGGSYVGVCHQNGTMYQAGKYVQTDDPKQAAGVAMRGRLVARIPVSKDVQTELQHVLQMAGVSPELAASTHDADAERLFIKSQIVKCGLGTRGHWLYDIDGNDLDRRKYADEAWLDGQLKKMDYAKYVDTAEIRVGAGGAHTVWFDRFSKEELKDVYFAHTGGASPGAAASILLSETGIPSRKQGYTNGTAPKSSQASDDINTGGAAGTMVRVARKGGPGASSVHGYDDSDTQVRYIYHPRVLKRADYWAHHHDRYGSQIQSDTKNTGKPEEEVLKLTSSNHEVMFENGVAHEDIAGVWCRSLSIRSELINTMKTAGKTKINGVPVDDFFFTGTQTDTALKDACKGLKVGA
jgi:hypothetical protein